MNILVFNSGSSSLKYQLLRVNHEVKLLAKGQVDRIGINGSEIEQKVPGQLKVEQKVDIKNHAEAIGLMLKYLTNPEYKIIESLANIDAVGHRVAHGGDQFKESVIITPEVKNGIRDCFELAPLHNPANLNGIEIIEKHLPGIPQVAVFDTSFHQTMPEEAYLYGIPYKYYLQYHIRRYGFHGTSHKFVAHRACDLLGWDISTKKIISCHLGNGASITAIDGGKSVETSMGFTPNAGLLMGTRSGSIDNGIINFLASKEDKSVAEVFSLLNSESGVKGLSNGLSSDMRNLAIAMDEGNEDAARALKAYAHRVRHFIGAYTAIMNGVDLVIMTGGIGENNKKVRELCCSNLNFLGIDFDAEKNNRGEKDAMISKQGSRTGLMIVQTNEELVIAQETAILVNSMVKII